MTRNQNRVLGLAAALDEGTLSPVQLSDDEWGLMLLASGLNYCRVGPSAAQLVPRGVLANAQSGNGYFANDKSVRR